jgi:SAM-dependent methyltransferase
VIRPVSVLIPFEDCSAGLAVQQAARAQKQGAQVVLAGSHPMTLTVPDAKLVTDARGIGAAVQLSLAVLTGEATVVQPPDLEVQDYAALVSLIANGTADVVVGSPRHTSEGFLAATVSALGRSLTGLSDEAVLPGVTVLKTTVLRGLQLASVGSQFEAELRVKLAARHFRFASTATGLTRTGRPPSHSFARAVAYLRWGLFSNDANNLHEGYNTLARMDQAPRYNAWLGAKLRKHLGPRVLEIGAGIGTITRELLTGRELVIALEADPFYVERLKNAFRSEPRVRPVHASVEATDWEGLAQEGLDSVVLSNVLEHIEDDGLAIRQFRRVLPRGGNLVILVPALPALFGTIDQAIGHFRRYTPETLRRVIEAGAFRLESLQWMNILGIPGWFLNGRVLKRRSVPPLQLRVYDRIAPLLARAESVIKLPIGMSLLAVATAI